MWFWQQQQMSVILVNDSAGQCLECKARHSDDTECQRHDQPDQPREGKHNQQNSGEELPACRFQPLQGVCMRPVAGWWLVPGTLAMRANFVRGGLCRQWTFHVAEFRPESGLPLRNL
jgi:hypothetical protein